MNSLDIKNALEWFTAMIISLGGTSAIIIALSKWFGDRLANKLLEKDKAQYQRELEELKTSYQQEIETRKAELEKSKSLFFRYSEHQFSLYNDLWKNLCDLKHIGEELWERAEPRKLKEFTKQLGITKLSVEKSALLIEDGHYEELITVLSAFEKFEVGKLNLIQLRNSSIQELPAYGVNQFEIENVINRNGEIKKDFEKLLERLSKSFKHQIKGD